MEHISDCKTNQKVEHEKKENEREIEKDVYFNIFLIL